MKALVPSNLSNEPLAAVVRRLGRDRVWLGDLPERLVPKLVEKFGDVVLKAAEKTPADDSFLKSLAVVEKQPMRALSLFESGALEKRVRQLRDTGKLDRKASYFMADINLSDEKVLGRTGVLYLTCHKGCHFCQYRQLKSYEASAEELALIFLALKKENAHTIQWLSPTAYVPVLIEALFLAMANGFRGKIVYKSEGEDSQETLKWLEGIVDVYLPDAKFMRATSSERIGLSENYPERLRWNLKDMWQEVGPLVVNSDGWVEQGVLVRHLLMPSGQEDFYELVKFLKSFDREVPLHVMTGYMPMHAALGRSDIGRMVSPSERLGARHVLDGYSSVLWS